jgi:hypothetical protein
MIAWDTNGRGAVKGALEFRGEIIQLEGKLEIAWKFLHSK